MNWLSLILGFALAVALGAYLAGVLDRSRPHWSGSRRLWTAACVLPILISALTVAGVASAAYTSDNMRDLAMAAIAAVGGIFAVLALLGGLVGAYLAQRRT